MDDLISRQAAIDALHMHLMYRMGTDSNKKRLDEWINNLPSAQPEPLTLRVNHELTKEEYDKLMHDIKDAPIVLLPPAQPERKTGRWVERNPQNSPDCRLIECSECGNAYIVGYNIDYDDWIDGRNFCMKCGADLRGGNNGKNT